MGRSKTPPQISAAFSEHSCKAKEFQTTICPNVGSRIWAVSVLLIEGKVVRRPFGLAHDGPTGFRKRSAVHDVQRYVCCGKSEASGEGVFEKRLLTTGRRCASRGSQPQLSRTMVADWHFRMFGRDAGFTALYTTTSPPCATDDRDQPRPLCPGATS
jgi:hypothetical protein